MPNPQNPNPSHPTGRSPITPPGACFLQVPRALLVRGQVMIRQVALQGAHCLHQGVIASARAAYKPSQPEETKGKQTQKNANTTEGTTALLGIQTLLQGGINVVVLRSVNRTSKASRHRVSTWAPVSSGFFGTGPRWHPCIKTAILDEESLENLNNSDFRSLKTSQRLYTGRGCLFSTLHLQRTPWLTQKIQQEKTSASSDGQRHPRHQLSQVASRWIILLGVDQKPAAIAPRQKM